MPIVQNPTAGDIHVSVPLTNFAQKFLQDERSFIATRAFPNLPVAKQFDQYYTFNREDTYRDMAQARANGTESVGAGFRLSRDPYMAEVYAIHKDVTDRDRSNQDAAVQLDNSASQFVMLQLLIRRERDFATTFMSTGVWDTDTVGVESTPSGNQFIRWNEASSDPIRQIRDAKTAVHQNTGKRPNKMVCGREAYDALTDNDELISRISGGATTGAPALVTRQLIAQALELDEIFVMDSVYNTSLEGAADAAFEFVGGKDALLYYAPSSLNLIEPSAGAQFSWTGFMGATANGQRIRRFRMEQLQADRIEGEMAFDHKVTSSELGYFFNGVVP